MTDNEIKKMRDSLAAMRVAVRNLSSQIIKMENQLRVEKLKNNKMGKNVKKGEVDDDRGF